jgi:hypothetical protein
MRTAHRCVLVCKLLRGGWAIVTGDDGRQLVVASDLLRDAVLVS